MTVAPFIQRNARQLISSPVTWLRHCFQLSRDAGGLCSTNLNRPWLSGIRCDPRSCTGLTMRTMIEAPILVTPRLRLRMLQADDFDEYVAIHSDFEVTRFTTRSHLTREEAWKHMATIVGHWHLRGYGMWGVEEIATKRLVGRVGYHCPEGWPEFELGWTIGREFWGRG